MYLRLLVPLNNQLRIHAKVEDQRAILRTQAEPISEWVS